MRPTTKDLAKAAGVSLATVDRVLNGRPGVRKATVDAVNEAIKNIGFVRNISAANLARNRVYRLAFLLPKSGDEFLMTLIRNIDEARPVFENDSVQVDVRQALENDPHQISSLLSALDPETIDGVAIIAPESPQVRDAMMRLEERGIHVVELISGQPGAHPTAFVGIDSNKAGATAGRLLGRFLGGRTGQVLVISETMNARDSIERRLGFDGVLTGDFPNLTALPSLETYGDTDRAKQIVANAYENFANIVGCYVLCSEARDPLEAIAAHSDASSQVIIAHERTRSTEAFLRGGTLDALIAQDPGHLVRSASRLLRASCDGRKTIASQEHIRIEILIRENLT